MKCESVLVNLAVAGDPPSDLKLLARSDNIRLVVKGGEVVKPLAAG